MQKNPIVRTIHVDFTPVRGSELANEILEMAAMRNMIGGLHALDDFDSAFDEALDELQKINPRLYESVVSALARSWMAP